MGLLATGSASAGDEPFAARTFGHFFVREHTHERAGTAGSTRYAAPSVSVNETGGYIGGNRLRATPGTAIVPNPGTFGWDYVGFGKYPGRIFLGFGPDRAHQRPFQTKYHTDPPR
jgi:hypothetical protein